jgi:hypothetical protein
MKSAIALDEFDIDTATEVYAGRERIEVSEFDEGVEICEANATGHLFQTQCGETICVHCGRIAWR